VVLGLSQTGTMSFGGGGGAGKANFSDLNFMHALDKASPVLMTKCATGEHFKEATLVSRKAGKGQQEYLIVKMKEVFITSVQPSGSSEHPMESVSMTFSHIDLEYKPQKEDGSLDAGVHFIYDVKKNENK
jgi:type VI secretion system secreted protein Hcp